MKVVKFIRLLFVSVALLMVVSCSNWWHRDGEQTPNEVEGQATQTAGIGEQGDIIGYDKEGNQILVSTDQDKVYYFDFDRSNFKDDEARDNVILHAKYLVAHPNVRVRLEGHTDSRGSREYNIALGERRAKYVAEVLRLQGVKASQIDIVSYGQEKPAVNAHTEEAYQLNRRVRLSYQVS